MIELRLLGDLVLRDRDDGREIRSVLTQRKRVSLLAYLALRAEDGFVSRDTLLALFWPERPEKRARHALSQALYVLRRGLGGDVVETRGQQEVRVRPGLVWCDAVAFQERLASGDREGALELYRGPLLDGVHVEAGPRFEHWVERTRRTLHDRAFTAASALAEEAAREGRLEKALGRARHAAELAPLDEAAVRRVIRLLVAQSRRGEAVRVLRRFTERLQDELDLEPSDETLRTVDEPAASSPRDPASPSVGDRAPEAGGPERDATGDAFTAARRAVRWPVRSRLLAGVLGAAGVLALIAGLAAVLGEPFPALGPAAGEDEDILSVAVIPFESVQRGSGGEASFIRSVHGELLSQLSRVRGLTVIAPSAVRRFQAGGKSPSEIGRELEVDAVLTGRARGVGDELRLRVRLTEPVTDSVLWTAVYDRPRSVGEFARLEREVAAGVSSALRAHLAPVTRTLVGWPPTGSLLAYEEYLRGRDRLVRFHDEAQRPIHVDRAVDLFRRAIRRDSSFAEAQAGLALALASRYHLTGEERWLSAAYASVQRAKLLRPDLAETHLALGYTHWAADSNRVALEHIRRAVERKPSSYLATLWMVTLHDNLNQYDQGVRWARRLLRLDPLRPSFMHAMAWELRCLGLYEAADEWARRALEIEPGHRRSAEMRAYLLALQRRPAEGLEMMRGFVARYPSRYLAMLDAAMLALVADRPSEARSLFRQARMAARRTTPRASASIPDSVPLTKGEAYAELLAGDSASGRAALRSRLESLRRSGDDGYSHAEHFEVATIHSALGDADSALDHLEAAYRKGRRNYWWMEIHPLLEPLRQEPRYRELAETMKDDIEGMRRIVRGMDIDIYPGEGSPILPRSAGSG